MEAVLRVPDEMRPALARLDQGLVFVPSPVGDDWDAILAELTEAFHLTQQAFTDGVSVVYAVQHADLLGQRGPGPAMVATGLLSAARTTAFEGRKPGIRANVLALEDDTPAEVTATWAEMLLSGEGPTGELIRLGGSHLGKALP